jgi:hypothetical protein
MDATTPAGDACSPATRLLESLDDDHQIQRALCRDLEAIADALPGAPTPAVLRRIGERIERVTQEHFPRAIEALAALPPDCSPTREELAMLDSMQATDATHGEDLVTALWQHVLRTRPPNPAELGYMLRCYFDGCRRAIAFKESLVARAVAALRQLSSETRSAAAFRD